MLNPTHGLNAYNYVGIEQCIIYRPRVNEEVM